MIKKFLKESVLTRDLYHLSKRQYLKFKQFKLSKRMNKYGYSLLEDISCCLDKMSIPGYIYYGTLLGMVREKSFIKHDYDIDFAVLIDNEEQIDRIHKAMDEQGYQYRSTCKVNGIIVEDSYIYHDIRFDLSYFRMEGNNRVTYVLYREKDVVYKEGKFDVLKEINPSMPDTIEKFHLFGTSFNIPQNPESVIEKIYGSQWRIPIKNWNWKDEENKSECDFQGDKEYYVGKY